MPPLIAASLVVFLEVLSIGAVFPVMSSYCEQLGASHEAALAWTGLMFFLIGAPRIFMNTVWGRLSDHRGRKPILFLATFGTFAGSILWALAPTLHSPAVSGLMWLGISRLLAGFFQAQATLTQAIAADVTAPEKRAAAMGHLGAAFGFGMLGGIMMGGLVGEYISLSAVGWAAGAAQATSLLIILFHLRETHPVRDAAAQLSPDRFEKIPIAKLLRDPSITLLLVVTLIMTAGHMILVPTLPDIFHDWYGYEKNQSWIPLTLWMFVGVMIQGGAIRPTVRRLGERKTILIGLITLAAGFFWFATEPHLGGFWAAAILIAVGGSLSTPALSGLLSRNTLVGDQGAVQGLNQSLTALGRTISYATVALIATTDASLHTHYWVGGGLVALSALILLGSRRAASAP